MSFRTYNAGELQGVPTTVEQQLAHGANQTQANGKLMLCRCVACGGEHGRENHISAILDGFCAWCGWSQETSE